MTDESNKRLLAEVMQQRRDDARCPFCGRCDVHAADCKASAGERIELVYPRY